MISVRRTPEPQRSAWLEFVVQHPVSLAVVGVATIVGGFYAPVAALFEKSSSGGDALISSTDESAHVLDQTPTEAAQPRVQPIDIGTCLQSDASTVVPCDAGHTYEIFALGDCTEAAMVQYLGGDPAIEQLRVEPAVISLSGTQICVVDDPTGEPSFDSARGVLQRRDAHSAWRLCVDARLGDADVPCSDTHTGEIVQPKLAPDRPLDCVEAVENYLNARFRDVASQLGVAELQYPEGPRCLVPGIEALQVRHQIENMVVVADAGKGAQDSPVDYGPVFTRRRQL
jgi:hypothetical protein